MCASECRKILTQMQENSLEPAIGKLSDEVHIEGLLSDVSPLCQGNVLIM